MNEQSWHSQSERGSEEGARQAKKGKKRKQLNYAFGQHSQHIITQIHSLEYDNTWAFFCFRVSLAVESGAKTTSRYRILPLCHSLPFAPVRALTLNTPNETKPKIKTNSLTLCVSSTVEIIKNFMRKKGSTQVTVRNKYLYRRGKKRARKAESSRAEPNIQCGIFIYLSFPFFLFYFSRLFSSSLLLFACCYCPLFGAINMILLSFSFGGHLVYITITLWCECAFFVVVWVPFTKSDF